MNVVRWNPFAELDEFLGRRVADSNAPSNGNGGLSWHPPVDIRETDASYVFDLEVPAVNPKDITVSVRASVLSVSGERSFSDDDSQGQVHRRERRHGKFTRSFRLPNDANDDEITANAKDGVITISVAKRKQAQARAIEVQVA